ncbi:MAG: hypothetical protein J2P19_35740 [Pseudonocardia sp.]|nr:hypothetical protein [Pseudonocardia sp.]
MFSVAGLPALSVPAGSEHGLPIGVQVAARAWHEHVALAAGALVERELSGGVGYAGAGVA